MFNTFVVETLRTGSKFIDTPGGILRTGIRRNINCSMVQFFLGSKRVSLMKAKEIFETNVQ